MDKFCRYCVKDLPIDHFEDGLKTCKKCLEYKRNNDETYFQRYYQEKTQQPCVCDICGSAMSCKSNLAKGQENEEVPKVLSVSSL